MCIQKGTSSMHLRCALNTSTMFFPIWKQQSIISSIVDVHYSILSSMFQTLIMLLMWKFFYLGCNLACNFKCQQSVNKEPCFDMGKCWSFLHWPFLVASYTCIVIPADHSHLQSEYTYCYFGHTPLKIC